MKKLLLPHALFGTLIFQACGGSGRPASSQVDTLDLTASALYVLTETVDGYSCLKYDLPALD
ncbi:MAG: hypothetical protein K2J18_06095 [Paramuribaculum sp.]|nr:hypothetical protein [Bacteroides sp.]MDE6826323.1 hypothetical protein [Paramuribaculum sp.]